MKLDKYLRSEMEEYEKWFRLIKNHLQNKKLDFIKYEDEDGYRYRLENIAFLRKKYKLFYNFQ